MLRSPRLAYLALSLVLLVMAFSAGTYNGPAAITAVYRIIQPPPPGAEESRFIARAQQTDNTKVLVFVHGVTGTPSDTWTNENNGQKIYWPNLILEDERFNDYDVFVMSYYTPRLDIGPSISQIGDALQKDLVRHKIFPDKTGKSRYREIIFICHSMANLVIRNMMVVNPLPRSSQTRIPLILSIASPSAGSALAEFGNRFSPNQTFKEMSQIETNSFLQLLNGVWKQSAFDTEIACAYEELHNTALGRKIVEKESATAVCTRPDVRGFQADHISIVKPTGSEDPIHQWVVEHIQRPRAKEAWELDRWTKNEIIIGGKDFPESNLQAAMIALVLRSDPRLRDLGLKVKVAYQIGHASRVFSALVNRRIDIYPEYDGSLLHEYLRIPLPGDTAAEGQLPERKTPGDDELVNLELQKELQTVNLRYFPHFGFHNPYVLVMNRPKAQRLGVLGHDGKVTMTALARRSEKSLVLISDQEFFYRNEWFGLQERYNLKFVDVEYVKHNTVYERVKAGISENLGIVGVGFGSDAELNVADPELIKVEDDKGVFPHYHPAPLVDKLLLKKFPTIESALYKLKGILSIEEMSMLLEDHKRLMSKAVDEEARVQLTEYLARVFLERKGVLVKQ